MSAVPPKPPEDQPEPPRKCGNCDFWRRVADKAEGVCLFNPPVVHVVMMTTGGQTDDGKLMVPQGQNQVRMQQVPMSLRPGTVENDKCGQHLFADEPGAAEFAATVFSEELRTLNNHANRIATFLREMVQTGGGKKQ